MYSSSWRCAQRRAGRHAEPHRSTHEEQPHSSFLQHMFGLLCKLSMMFTSSSEHPVIPPPPAPPSIPPARLYISLSPSCRAPVSYIGRRADGQVFTGGEGGVGGGRAHRARERHGGVSVSLTRQILCRDPPLVRAVRYTCCCSLARPAGWRAGRGRGGSAGRRR